MSSKILELITSEQLVVKEFNWTSEFLPGWKDIEVEFNLGGYSFKGRSLKNDSNKALMTALVESIERSLLLTFNIKNSNGLAGHPNPRVAKENAENELIERDVVLGMFYSGRRYESFEEEVIDKALQNLGFALKHLESRGISFYFYKVRSIRSTFTSICIFDGSKALKRFGINLTSATSGSERDAVEKSFIEGLANVIHQDLRDKDEAMSYEDFLNLEDPLPEDHHKLMKNCSFGETILSLYKYNESPAIQPEADIIAEEINWKSHHLYDAFEGFDLYFYKATSLEMQGLFWGKPSENNLKLNRLAEYNPGREKWIELPHPLG